MTADAVQARRIECEEDGLYFNRYFFKRRFGSKMIISGHHKAMQRALDRTMLPPSDPEFISRLVINVPPGYSKTELASICYMARGIARNPAARFLHLSYSDKLVLLNSGVSREIIKSSPFQEMWPVDIKADTDSKKIWHTSKNGGVTATASGGQVTGFRAGHMDDKIFTGALVIDDPVKPDDAYSEVVREGVNNAYNETISSRVAIETVPIIVIMQRIHWSDLSGYLLRGGSGEKWHHLCLPIVIDNSESYPEEYTHGIEVEHGLPDGWLWPFKHNDSHELSLKSHRRKYAAQYMQNPIRRDEETSLWSNLMIGKAKIREFDGEEIRTIVAVDPATTNTEVSDEHGIIAASEYDDGLFKVVLDYTRKGSPNDWAQASISCYEDSGADAIVIETNQGGDMCESTLRNAGFTGRIIRVTAKKGKTLRAEPVAALYEMGKVGHSAGLHKMEDEMIDFDPVTQKSFGKSPNRLDALVYALLELSDADNSLRELLNIAMGQYQ